jgi:DNA-binding MarR family transcriptional regulator
MEPIDFNGLDSAIHGPVRLGAMTALQVDGSLDFTTLRKRLNVSDGALGLHLARLEEAGYIRCEKQFIGRRPRTTYILTASGRGALAQYLRSLQKVIDMVQNSRRHGR